MKRVRKVLDFEPASKRVKDPEATYREALDRRLNREVEVRRAPRKGPAAPKGGTLSAEEWEAAHDALQRARDGAALLATLLEQQKQKRADLEALEAQRSAAQEPPRAYLRLLGVRRKAAAVTPVPEPVLVSEPVEEPIVVAPPVDHEALAASLSLEEVRAQILAVDAKLAEVAARERDLTTNGDPAVKPVREGDHLLYARPRPRGHAEYFFRSEATREGVPAPRPPGYRVAVDPETHVPSLEPAKS